jgi:IS605 OrfB family transposase
MILIESHYIKPSHQNFIHCDWISYIVKNLRNSSNYHIRQHIFNEDKKKKALTGLASVCGLDMQNYLTKSSFLDNDNNWIFNFTNLYHNLNNKQEFRTDTHPEYLELHQQNTEHIKAKIAYYEHLTLQNYINNRINSLNKRKNKKITQTKVKKLKHKIDQKSFTKWKAKKIAKLQQQALPIKINTKILKQTFRELNQNYSDYFKRLKEYKINPSKYKGLPKLPGYKPKGSTGRATVTIPIEAISNHFSQKDKLKWLEQGIDIDYITELYNTKLVQQYIKQNKQVYFYTIANFNILIQSHIPKEQIKEIKIVPQTLGYKICVIYDCNKIKSNEKNSINEVITEERQDINITTKQAKLTPRRKSPWGNIKEKKDKQNEKALTLNKIKQLVKEGKVVASADLGLNNTMTIVTTTPTINPIKINGRVMKSINQYYNKTLASKKSELSFTSSNNALTSHSIKSLTQKRNNQIHNSLHQISSYVVNWLKTNHIEALIVGYNENWKVEVNTGSKNNQNFVQIPFLKLINQLKYKCEKETITLIITEESYTSKASFLDLDELPKFIAGIKNEVKFSGKRIKRGLYKSSTGVLIHADVNGAYNILRKVIGDAWVRTYTNSIKDYAINPLSIPSSFGQYTYKTRKSNRL